MPLLQAPLSEPSCYPEDKDNLEDRASAPWLTLPQAALAGDFDSILRVDARFPRVLISGKESHQNQLGDWHGGSQGALLAVRGVMGGAGMASLQKVAPDSM